jgi:four helix bundle protein
MAAIYDFKDIESWKEARELTKKIYKLTSKGKFERDFGLRDQLRRASVSIMSNIAEGFDSGTTKSFNLYLNYSYRSASEVESLLYISFDIDYLSENEFTGLIDNISNIKKLIGGFIKYLKATKH